MQFISFLVLALTSLSVSAATSYSDNCGADSKVLNSTTFSHNDVEVTVSTTYCPGFADAASNSSTSITKRTITQCNTYCEVECANLGSQPFISDCQALTDALEDLYPASFNAPANTMTKFWSHTCQYTYYNLDTTAYSVCYMDLGLNGISVGDSCFADWPAPSATNGGLCAASGTSGNDWFVEVSYPF